MNVITAVIVWRGTQVRVWGEGVIKINTDPLVLPCQQGHHYSDVRAMLMLMVDLGLT